MAASARTCHAEPPHRPRGARFARGRAGGRRRGGGPRRDLHAAGRLRAAEPRVGGTRRRGLRPRNAAAGSVRKKDPTVTARRPLDLSIYQISHLRGGRFDTHWQELEALRRAGFTINPRNKVDDLVLPERLGSTGHHPRWAIALKFTPRQAATRGAGHRGAGRQDGDADPGGPARAGGGGGSGDPQREPHNEDEIRRKDIRVGDTVLLVPAPWTGRAIPFPHPLPRLRRPRDAPGGGSLLAVSEQRLPSAAQGASSPLGLAARDGHRGPGRADDRRARGPRPRRRLRRSLPPDTGPADAPSSFATKSAQNLVDAIERSRRRGLGRLLHGLGIRMVGEHAGQLLAGRFHSLPRAGSRHRPRDRRHPGRRPPPIASRS